MKCEAPLNLGDCIYRGKERCKERCAFAVPPRNERRLDERFGGYQAPEMSVIPLHLTKVEDRIIRI